MVGCGRKTFTTLDKTYFYNEGVQMTRQDWIKRNIKNASPEFIARIKRAQNIRKEIQQMMN